jgi:hypothetical protein
MEVTSGFDPELRRIVDATGWTRALEANIFVRS